MNGINLGCLHNASFRVRGISSDALENLERTLLRDCSYRKGRYHKDTNLSVLVIELDESMPSALLKAILATIPAHDGYEFYISTFNNNESFIVEVPRYVCALFQEIGGGMFFSYTYAGDESE